MGKDWRAWGDPAPPEPLTTLHALLGEARADGIR